MSSGDLERLRHAMRPAFLWDVGRRRIVWANAAAVRYFGAPSLAELVERPFDAREAGVRALTGAARDLAGVKDSSNAAGGHRVALLFPSAGRDEPLYARVRPHLLADGRPGLLVVAENADPARMTPPAVLSEILDEMPQPVAALDPAGALAYANPAALELLDESGLAALAGIFPTRTAALDFLARAREAGTAVITREADTNIGRRTLRLIARTAHDGDLIIIMIDDLTDRLAAERMEAPLAAEPAVDAGWEMQPDRQEETGEGPAALRADELEALRRLVEELSPASGKSDTVTTPSGDAEATPVEKQAPAGEAKKESAPPQHDSGARITIRVKPKAEAPAAALPESAGEEGTGEGNGGSEAAAAPPVQREDTPPRVSVRISGATAGETEAGREGPAGEEPAASEEPGAMEAPPAQPETTERKPAGQAEASTPERTQEELPAKESVAPSPAKKRDDVPAPGREPEEGAEHTMPAEAADAAERGPEQARPPERPEPPSLVREVLDHRPEPIILHRAEAFYFANRAARELFGFAPEDTAWDNIARQLAAAAEGEDVLLPDAEGTLRRFRLKRDVFPWRAGVVVQSTLLPVQAGVPEREQDAASRKAPPLATPDKDVTAGLEKLREQVQAVATRAPAPVIRIHAHPRRQPAQDAAGEGDARATRAGQGPAATTAPLPEAAPAPVKEDNAPQEEVNSDPALEHADLRAVLEAASEGVITLNEQGEILSFSAGAAELFGLPAAEALGRPLRDLLAEDSRAALDARLAALREGAEDAAHARDRGREVSARRPDGEEVVLFMTIGMLERRRPVADEHTARYCVLVRDITPYKRRERELEAARAEAERQSARKSEFLARISHELRTPLNAILGFSDVLRQELFGKLGNEKYLDYARDIHESGEHLLSLVNDLLDLARIEAGRFQVQFTEVDLAEVVEEAVRLLRDQAQEAQIDLRVVIPQDLPKVVADARSVKQILLNLLSNAIKYGRQGGRVVVSLRQLPEGGLELAVKDDGPGMSEEELQQALEPFARVERTGEGKPGTGLGLPLAKALAEANKARFEVESAPGEGTVARVVFPPHRVLA